jgi:hypothetical protein
MREEKGMNTSQSEDQTSPDEIAAAAERTPSDVAAPEVDSQTKHLTKWDESPDSSGHAAHKVPAEDETSIAERLVNEGTEEADRVQRIAAADPDFEP